MYLCPIGHLYTFSLLLITSTLLTACSGGDYEAYQAYKKEGEDFLKANKQKPGIVTLPSGLQYIVLKESEGPQPLPTEEVTVHYHGTLIDGTVFDSSVDKGKPLTFPVSAVIAGWQEALQLMPLGAKWKIFVPAHLAYGEKGAGSTIKPGSVLIFEVELLSING